MASPDFDRLYALLRELEKTCEKAKELREQLASHASEWARFILSLTV